MLQYSTYEQVEQHTHLEARVLLEKAHIILAEEGLPSLGLVHKKPVDRPPKAAVVLVHGFAQNRYTWHGSKRSFSAWLVSEGFEVYNLELRGHGNSRRDGQMGAECFADYVEDVTRVAEALPTPAFWLGHSLGGAAIYGAASTMRPLRCLGVIGLGAVFHFGKGNLTMKTLCHISHKLRHIPLIEHLQIKTSLTNSQPSHTSTRVLHFDYLELDINFCDKSKLHKSNERHANLSGLLQKAPATQ